MDGSLDCRLLHEGAVGETGTAVRGTLPVSASVVVRRPVSR